MELETSQWVKLVQILSAKEVWSTLYSPSREAAKKRAAIWREAAKNGLSTTQIANAFNVTSRAVRKALKTKNSG
jgi:hypothetical protein